MTKRLTTFLSLPAAMLLGLVVGLYAQSNATARLAKLSEEKAEISKMDLVLLNTRVEVLQQVLKDDLALPFAPTSFSYDADKKKIRIAVHVDPTFLARASANQLTKTLETRARALCIAPELAEGNLPYLFFAQPPQEYCAINFFTGALGPAEGGLIKDVAVFQNGKLTLK